MGNIKFEIGQKVSKKSKKPFKSGNVIETIKGFGTNSTDPKKRECAIFEDDSICNLGMLELSYTDFEESAFKTLKNQS